MHYEKSILYGIRNKIPVDDVIIGFLGLDHRFHEGHLRFQCPRCSDRHTTTRNKNNLARCFRCKFQMNPIDLLMEVKGFHFQQAVAILARMLPFYMLADQLLGPGKRRVSAQVVIAQIDHRWLSSSLECPDTP